MRTIKKFENFQNDVVKTNKWKFKISIKHLLTDENFSSPTDDNMKKIAEISDAILYQLTKLEKKTKSSNIIEDDMYDILEELEQVKDHFEFTKHLADGTIPESEWEDYSFGGNFEEILNDECLTSLYDLGDKRVINKRNESEKYLLIS